MDKKGDYKYGVLLYLILAVIILIIAIVFIYQEYWTDDLGSREACAQSIQLRALIPEARWAGLEYTSFKSNFPLKCKTDVVEIEKKDVVDIELAQRKIADSIVECWALFGNGDYRIFPSAVYGSKSVCVPCSRIHLSEDSKKYMVENNINISIAESLNLLMTDDYTYYSYLRDSGDAFSAFDFAASKKFNLTGEEFSILKNSDEGEVTFYNRYTGGTYSGFLLWANNISLPEFIYPEKGDLTIVYGDALFSDDIPSIGKGIPFMIYFQSGQEANPFEEVRKSFLRGAIWSRPGICEEWEGIPA